MRRRAEQAWIEFTEWCLRRRLQALPAHPWTVAAFARWCERRMPAARIARWVGVIARVHLMACQPVPDRHPTVRRTLKVIELRQAARRRGAALFSADGLVEDGDGPTAAGGTDRAEREGRPASRRTLRSRPALVPRRPLSGR